MSDSPYDCSKNPLLKKKRDWSGISSRWLTHRIETLEDVIEDQRKRIKSLLNHVQVLSIVVGLLITSILIASQFI